MKVSLGARNKYPITLYDQSSDALISELVKRIQEKDTLTYLHSKRVQDYSLYLSLLAGIKGKKCEEIRIAGLLHDIGKLAVCNSILKKNTKLTLSEYTEMKNHPQVGYNLLSKHDKLSFIARITLFHHERWDGKGYPLGICGTLIPIESRILAITDAFDAMTGIRPYTSPLQFHSALNEIEKNAGQQFDPFLSRIFIDGMKKYNEGVS